jgi:hypothetical protein
MTALIRCNGCGYLMFPRAVAPAEVVPALKVTTPDDVPQRWGDPEVDWDFCADCANTLIRLVQAMHRASTEDDPAATQAMEDINRLLAAVVAPDEG